MKNLIKMRGRQLCPPKLGLKTTLTSLLLFIALFHLRANKTAFIPISFDPDRNIHDLEIPDRELGDISESYYESAAESVPTPIKNSSSELQMEISGTVTDANDGTPLPGVSIVIQGTTNGTQTDFDGNYSIDASVGDILVFSYIGMKTQSVTIGNTSNINISLQEDSSQLDEVVVTALGMKREKRLWAMPWPLLKPKH
ncbi:MAG: carboxypeptidase-like regulatory domain-containing protein [Flavobacteriaceae bacterium]